MRILVATAVLVVSLAAFATPSTLVTIPSTDIQPAGSWHLGIDSFVPLTGDQAVPFEDLGLTYGISPRFEAGVDLISPSDTPLWLNAKYQILPPERPIALAAGIFNAGTQSNAANQSVAYVVGSKTFSGTRLTIGGFKAREAAFGDDDTGFMVGLDRTMGKWWLGADYLSGENPLGSWNVGVAYTFADNVSVILGYDNFNDDNLAEMVNCQVDINF